MSEHTSMEVINRAGGALLTTEERKVGLDLFNQLKGMRISAAINTLDFCKKLLLQVIIPND